MTRPLTVLFKADCVPHVDILVEIARAVASQGRQPNFIAVTLESLNPTGARASLLRRGFAVVDIPRVDASTTPVWQDPTGRALRANYAHVVSAFEAAVLQSRPDLFVIPYDVGHYTAAFLRCCKNASVPSLLVQEGLIIPDDGTDLGFADSNPAPAGRGTPAALTPRARRALGRMVRAIRLQSAEMAMPSMPPLKQFGLNGADVIAAIGPHYGRMLRARGVAADSVVVTGLPRFDVFWRMRQQAGVSMSEPRGASGVPVALVFQSLGFFYGRPRDTVLAKLHELNEAAALLGREYRLMVRLRPEEDRADYESLAQTEFPFLEFVSGDVPLVQHLRMADVAIGSASTAQIEAMMLGLPVIDVQPTGNDRYGFVGTGAALPARGAPQLAEQVRQVTSDATVRAALAEGRRAFLTDRVLFDGRSSERVARLLYQMRRA